MKTLRLLLQISIACSACSIGFTQEVKTPSYHLFRPVPQEKLREMESDRPDVTETPFTVDAGHFQYEADLVKFEQENDRLTHQRTVMINQANLKLGITGSTDVQVVLQSYGKKREIDLDAGTRTSSAGLGDMSIRIKQSLIGNDGGNFAIAVMPYLKFPTSKFEERGRYEGGVILPMQVKLPGDWKLGLQLEADRLKDKYDDDLHTELLQSLTLSHEILKGLDGLAETFYRYDFKQHHWANFLNAALQLEIADNFRLDAGFNYGIQSDAEKNYFVGTSFRF